MALPFYNQGDQDIYAGGDHFIPQQQYRLNYTPSQSLASTIGNTGGVTGAQAANPYIYPQGGGGGGGFSNTNKYGLNLDTMKTISQPRYVEQGGPANMYGGNYVKDSRQIAQDAAGNWKDVDTNQNPYHGNIQEFPSIIKKGFELAGLKQTDDPFKGTWYGSDWSDADEEKGFYSRATGPKNIIQRWMENRDIKKQEEKAAADKAAADAAVVNKQKWQQDYAGWQSPSGRDHEKTGGIGSKESKAGGAPGTKEASADWRAQGGRIGLYAGGDAEDYPENESENIFEFMRDQDIPISEEVEGGPTEEQIAMVMDMDGKGIDMETISSITQLGKETIMNILGVEMANGGIARLL